MANEPSADTVSVNRMRLISLAATSGSLLLFVFPPAGIAGILVLPSYGSYYVGDTQRFSAGLMGRVKIMGGGVAAFVGTLAYCWNQGCSYHIPVGLGGLYSLGAYFNVLRVLNLHEDFLKLAADDEFGRKLQDMEL